jgi:hypothetical protein
MADYDRLILPFHVPGLSDAVGPNPLVTSFPAADTFTIAAFKMPGKWTLLDAPKVFGWEIRQGFGLSGAVVVPRGDPLVIAKFRGEMWEPADYALYKEIRRAILVKPVFSLGGALLTAAMGISHPELNALGVKSVVMWEIRPTIQEDTGLWVAHVDFLQYRPPVRAEKQPKVEIPAIAPPNPTPKNALELEQDKLSAGIVAQKAANARK